MEEREGTGLQRQNNMFDMLITLGYAYPKRVFTACDLSVSVRCNKLNMIRRQLNTGTADSRRHDPPFSEIRNQGSGTFYRNLH
jgi:hypothetical protein